VSRNGNFRKKNKLRCKKNPKIARFLLTSLCGKFDIIDGNEINRVLLIAASKVKALPEIGQPL
jgi:hypothetical protein